MGMDRDPNVYDRDPMVVDRDARVADRDTGGSNFLAFLIGGLVIAIGLLAFLFYDGGSTGRDVSTTGSSVTAPATLGTDTRPSTPTTPPAAAPARDAAPAAPVTTPAAPAAPRQ